MRVEKGGRMEAAGRCKGGLERSRSLLRQGGPDKAWKVSRKSPEGFKEGEWFGALVPAVSPTSSLY